MDQRVIDLYQEYLSVPLRRRIFLKRLSDLVGGDQTALSLVPLLEAQFGPGPAAFEVRSNAKKPS